MKRTSFPRLQNIPNGGERKSLEGEENGGRKMTFCLRNVDFAHSISENTKSRRTLF